MDAPFTLMLTLLLLSSVFSVDIYPGSTLYASNPTHTWTSLNKNFSVGFIADGSTHYAAVTYNGIPVWKAGGSNKGGGPADSSASLRFLANGNLCLVNGSTGSIVWQSNTSGHGVISATLDDSGNFVLKNSTGSVWSTFGNPTDTILPSQNFATNQVLRSGLYSFNLHSSGNLTLRWNNYIVYWSLGLGSSLNIVNLTSPSLSLESNGTLSVFDPSLSSPVVMAYSSDYAEGSGILRFLRLDSDGNLRIYSSAKETGKITERWKAVTNQCLVFGYCGDVGICSFNDSGPFCGCPSPNFDPIEPNNRRKGCKRRVQIEDCPGRETMLQLDQTQFLTYPPELDTQRFAVGIAACRLNCLSSGSCIASTALADGLGSIYMKFPGFLSGYQSPALRSTSFLKVCDPNIPNPSISSRNARGYQAWIVASVVICTIFGFVVLEGVLLLWLRRKNRKSWGFSSQYSLLDYVSRVLIQFSYKELRSTTKGFKDKIGGGEFGYGMVLLEIVSGRRSFEVSPETDHKKFFVWAFEEFEKGNVKEIVDKSILHHEEVNMGQVIRAIQVGFWCIQENPSHRPTMGKVVQMLEGITAIRNPPNPNVVFEEGFNGKNENVSGHDIWYVSGKRLLTGGARLRRLLRPGRANGDARERGDMREGRMAQSSPPRLPAPPGLWPSPPLSGSPPLPPPPPPPRIPSTSVPLATTTATGISTECFEASK
ncbi:hypothetical protein Vadar_000495 [Vaccinium darrowii]|uniref:Uncharacterized protein n=1 Tax=Vaccinium darrowii TaxID=229202 RepID=A0ACB7YC14_9ERIC|nr:hypothetical protein Vadar_000495 [Vaccinium darrowii]